MIEFFCRIVQHLDCVFMADDVSSQVEKDISEIYLKLHQSFEDESNFLVSMQDIEKLLVSMDFYQNVLQG